MFPSSFHNPYPNFGAFKISKCTVYSVRASQSSLLSRNSSSVSSIPPSEANLNKFYSLTSTVKWTIHIHTTKNDTSFASIHTCLAKSHRSVVTHGTNFNGDSLQRNNNTGNDWFWFPRQEIKSNPHVWSKTEWNKKKVAYRKENGIKNRSVKRPRKLSIHLSLLGNITISTAKATLWWYRVVKTCISLNIIIIPASR